MYQMVCCRLQRDTGTISENGAWRYFLEYQVTFSWNNLKLLPVIEIHISQKHLNDLLFENDFELKHQETDCTFFTMSNRRERTFKLLIYESEYRQIQAWTNKHEKVETGGDLFGLWLDERTAVIQLVVGPGKQCRRTSTSFYQDIDYLKRMGDALTLEEGLCHIGEWHSHHRLNIPRPSGGDESTVWSNMDRYGLSRFCLLIANIFTTWKWLQLSSVPVDITVNGFLFEVDRRNQRSIIQAEFAFLHEESPFRSKYLPAIREGAESMNSAKDQLCVVVKKCRLMELERKKILQEKQEVEDLLAAERHKRLEAEKEVQRTKRQAYEIQKSLDAQKRVSEETEKTANRILQQSEMVKEEARRYEQRSRELEESLIVEKQARMELKAALAEEQKAHRETKENLWNSKHRSQELAGQESERRLQNFNNQSQRSYEYVDIFPHECVELETALFAKERQEREFAEMERRLIDSEKRVRELEKSLDVERHARQELDVSLARKHKEHEETWINLCNSLDGSQKLETSLAAQAQAREETERRLRSSQQRSQELETALAAHIQAREEAERRLYDSQQRSREREKCLAEQSRSREEAEWRYHDSEKRSRELENSLTAERQARRELEAREEARSRSFGWIVNRGEIALSKVIRKEDWGNVVEGSFHNSKVTVKKIRLDFLSLFQVDQSFFKREMEMAFECRHPCLLQFFGATYEQSPLFVFELPDTSLGAVIEQQPLEPSEITNIALDIAKGLNYLHTQSPDPIVHGDISSANVLLWKKGDTGWQAKISDFCTIHLLQQSLTDFPFDSIYAAAEAKESKSPKVDVYSFGVLLFEMITRELPDENRRQQQLEKLPHHYERLIKRCIRQNPGDRPSMLTVTEKIKRFL